MPRETEEILTLEEVDVYLQVGKRTVYRLVAQLPALTVGSSWRFRRREIDQWPASRVTQDSQAAAKYRVHGDS